MFFHLFKLRCEAGEPPWNATDSPSIKTKYIARSSAAKPVSNTEARTAMKQKECSKTLALAVAMVDCIRQQRMMGHIYDV